MDKQQFVAGRVGAAATQGCDMPATDQPLPIEDYALIGDCNTCALVGRNGSIDWLCWPRFDSAACFAALLGTPKNGRWLLTPTAVVVGSDVTITRSYRDGGMVLETVFTTPTGTAAVIDFMVMGTPGSALVRIVEGRSGEVQFNMDLALRFDYGDSIPWVTRYEGRHALVAKAGPEQVVFRSMVEFTSEDLRTVTQFTVSKGQRCPFVLSHGPSHLPAPAGLDAESALAHTELTWSEWSARCTYKGEHSEAVMTSLRVLKALTYNPTGGIAAAATTSLPEQLGGSRNWDYRYCWLRDATLTLFSLMHAGYFEEAGAWRDWLHRSVAGSPDQIQIMYGISGERRLAEWEVPWLTGYQGAAPVRIGNAASEQLQLDVFGEMMEALHQARSGGLADPMASWKLQCAIIDHLEQIWQEPDEGIWETRGGRKHFTYSKVMAWVAFDRMIKDAEDHKLPGPVDRWREIRDQIMDEVVKRGFHAGKNSFTQHFDTDELDASLLLIPLVGFLPHDDPRVRGTTAAIEKELLKDGFVLRYSTTDSKDGLPPGEGAFLACSFWLVDNWHMQDREADARSMFERLLALRNDLGLLSEEYDPAHKRMTGNFPQAFSHTALIATAMNLGQAGPAQVREAEAAAST
jgi:GH15 family glucan-1,4-alpha-glucosidase